MEKTLNDLKIRLREVNDLEAAAAVLSWDQSTYMPAGGAAARGRQMATLSRLAHEKFSDPAIGRLLDTLDPLVADLPYDDPAAALARVTRRDYERALRIPPSLQAALWQHGAESYQVWIGARPANDFTAVAPYLQKTIDLSRQIADCFPGYDHIADPLIDQSDEGMTARTVQALFSELRAALVPLAAAISAKQPPDDSFLHQNYPAEEQLAAGKRIISDYGYDWNRGRQDLTAHPFETRFASGDVRITTRIIPDHLTEALFSTLHESGHAMYEQGVDPALDASPLGGGTSSGLHESQSRLWENIVGRSHGLWSHYYPALQELFPTQLGNVHLDDFYRAINRVEPSLIRTEADEVTYNLHVMIRFDLELALLEGRLSVEDLPQAWHGRYQSDLGLHAPTDTNGVLQDVHWFYGMVGGMFQGYTLGNVMSATIYEAALDAEPGIPEQIARGEFGTLHGWLCENIYRYGRIYTADELIQRVSGTPLSIDPYMRYLHTKFGDLYELA